MGQISFGGERKSVLVMPVALGLRSILPCSASGVLKESLTWLLHWLMNCSSGEQSKAQRGAMLGPELSPTLDTVNVRQVS